MDLVVPVVCMAFYSLRLDSYTMTQGPTGGHRVVESRLMMVRAAHGTSRPVGLLTW
jgi:hypothetical protein